MPVFMALLRTTSVCEKTLNLGTAFCALPLVSELAQVHVHSHISGLGQTPGLANLSSTDRNFSFHMQRNYFKI